MANLGLGIGSFIQGLTNGANIARQWDRDAQDQKFKQEQLNLLQNQDTRATAKDARDATNDEHRFKLLEGQDARAAEAAKRAAEKDTTEMGWKKEDRATAEAERQANQPVKEAQRKSVLGAFTDAESEKEAKKAAGEAAAAGKMPEESFSDAYRRIGVPQVQQYYLSQGKPELADGFTAWSDKAQIRSAIDKVGKLNQSLASGDWDDGIKQLNDVLDDKAYLVDQGWKRHAEPIKDQKGNTIGVRTVSIGPNGETQSRDFNDIGELSTSAMQMLSPQFAYEHAKSVYDQTVSAKAEQAKTKNKLAADIELDNAKTRNNITVEGVKNENALDIKRLEIAGKIAEERAKAGGPQAVKDYANGVLQVMKFQSENNTGFAKLPPEQQASQAAAIYEQVRARSGQGGATPAAVPTSRTITPQAPAGAPPMARSILPSFAPPGQFVPET